MTNIPYDPKIDIALDSLQTFTACFECLKDEYKEKASDIPSGRENIAYQRLLTAVETQAAVNKAVLDLIESILAPTYSRAEHY